MKTLRSASVIAVAVAAMFAASASASSLPTLLANVKYVSGSTHLAGIYKVRPHTIVLSEAAGGNLTLTWATWTASSATGSGKSVVSGMGTTTTNQINVTAARVKKGKFTRLTIVFTESSGQTQTEKLRLTTGGGSPTWTS